MSHFTTIQTQIRDLDALNDAGVKLGFKFQPWKFLAMMKTKARTCGNNGKEQEVKLRHAGKTMTIRCRKGQNIISSLGD